VFNSLNVYVIGASLGMLHPIRSKCNITISDG